MTTVPTGPTDLSHLDTDTLQQFVDNDVTAFVDLLIALRQDAAVGTNPYAVPAMQFLVAQFADPEHGYSNFVLKLGKLATPEGKAEGPLTALPLLTYIKAAASALDTVTLDQKNLFDVIKSSLLTVLTRMRTAQQDSLDQIASQEFLNDLIGVDARLAPSAPPKP